MNKPYHFNPIPTSLTLMECSRQAIRPALAIWGLVGVGTGTVLFILNLDQDAKAQVNGYRSSSERLT
ncbi:MAG: hypothetical protein JNK38_28320 [Acidobacteria bacterium]|nr:hypothetical protein [Acidobacteriota bacterium]